jgi:hypothetical protein
MMGAGAVVRRDGRDPGRDVEECRGAVRRARGSVAGTTPRRRMRRREARRRG